MQHEIVFRPEIRLWCLETEITQSHKTNGAIIAQHWKRFNYLLRVNQVKLGTNWEKFGVTFKLAGKYGYSCAFQSDRSFEQFTSATISPGEFARFNHTGSMRFLSRTINEIYKNVIPEHPLNVAADRSILHYERYDKRFHWSNKNSIIEIYVPLNSDGKSVDDHE